MISIRNLTKSFGSNNVFKDISVDIADKEVVAIIGPSGCGKSTFIRCMNLLERPDSGQVLVGGEDITKPDIDLDRVRAKLGMVFQQFNLFSHLNVLENIILGPINVLKMPREQAIREAMEYLELVGISHRAFHMPGQLSGGQKQRVAIARSLAMHPEAILFDEPTSALDPTMVDEVLTVIRKLVNSGMTCVIVTHEMSFAKNVATQVFYMDEHGIYEKGSAQQIFENPAREKTRIFIEKLKVFTGDYALDDMDVYEILHDVGEYCYKYGMPRKESDAIRLVCEEYLVNLAKLGAALGAAARESSAGTAARTAAPRVTLTVRYNEREDLREVVFSDNLPRPAGTASAGTESAGATHLEDPRFDELSARLIRGYAATLEQTRRDGRNVLSLRMK